MTNTVSNTVSDETLDCIIQIESSGNPNIKAATSSALGLGQFLNATWLATVEKYRPEILRGRSKTAVLALRTDPSFSIEMLARFTEGNLAIVGRSATPGDLYLAHFLGAGTAQRVFRSSSSTSAVLVCGDAAAKANRSIFYKTAGGATRETTCGELRAWADAKMKKAAGKGWVKKFYKGPMGVAYGVAPVADVAEPETPDGFAGDIDVLHAQTDLKTMHYNPGVLDGLWGGNTSGALAAFITDRGAFTVPPATFEAFQADLDTIRREIDAAIAENFTRPTAEFRKTGKTEDVAKVAPEVVPAQSAAAWSLRGAVGSLLTGMGNVVTGYASKGWEFFTGNKDNIPTDSGTLEKVYLHLQAVPFSVWLLVFGVGLGFVAYKARRSVQITSAVVATGERI